MGNPYPADFETADGQVIYGGQIFFTTDNQPGGGGFTPVTTLDPTFGAEGGQLVIVDASGNDVEVVLPTAPDAGTEIAVWLAVDPGGNTVSVTSGELIDGESEIDLTEIYAQLVVVYTGEDVGAGWAVLSQGVPGGGGGLPTGWTADTPNVGDFGYAANSRTARLGPDGDPTDPDSGLILNMICIGGTTVDLFGGPGDGHLNLGANTGGTIQLQTANGVLSNPEATTAFSAVGTNGATVALDAGGLLASNLSDPATAQDAATKNYVDTEAALLDSSPTFTGTVDADGLGATIPYVTVQAAPPTTYLTPIVVDTTAVSGATYAWTGAAYVKISNLVT